ncbi:hypothetical protein CHLNCDRAFT_133828 [Chlorella variabilis]|uniref:Peptidase S1 domain-containing protein n=1 Tax=Chlorella variabilis TaxID=554065 RepID=E1ZFB8_CHLVA|nr:hypothetical protein CHLNCDRAFT_133828 [Chlorella variabilis]EFN55473.1 hypothetical protein CHLNCDRAFT_133828 [Chlorella variabilis]|eukprot:XP_005847575.1 hypothetical protein CHLNCDRAFT_133828 [Chlorella variabilis]
MPGPGGGYGHTLSLIDETGVVLTAAHCFYKTGQQLGWKVASKALPLLRFGAYLKDEPEEDQGGVRTYQAVSAIVHESFTVDDNFDIALVLVETALTGRKTIRLPAATPNPPVRVGTLLSLTGWGRLNGDLSDETATAERLQETSQLDLIDDDDCFSAYKTNLLGTTSKFSNDSMLCAGTLNRNTPFSKKRINVDACPGDSGGPLFRKDLGNDGLGDPSKDLQASA